MTINQKYTNSKYESCYENIMKKIMTREPNYVTATFNRYKLVDMIAKENCPIHINVDPHLPAE